ncbi:MAG: hypothetical protein LBL48_11085 [Azoarcus sp.]|jgi:hypothetical protein|nr:hypothetical protein [Azoarcus sp.]
MMNTCARVLLLATSLPALAAEPASAPPPSQSTATLAGRIFFTAAERRTLETNAKASLTPAAPPSIPPAVLPNPRRFDGALWRGNRLVALWFDGNADDPTDNPAIRIADGAPVVTLDKHRKALFSGKTWPPRNSGESP